MRFFLLWIVVLSLFGAGLWFFYESSQFLLDRDYLAGILHVVVGLATVRSAVEVARLAVVLELRS